MDIFYPNWNNNNINRILFKINRFFYFSSIIIAIIVSIVIYYSKFVGGADSKALITFNSIIVLTNSYIISLIIPIFLFIIYIVVKNFISRAIRNGEKRRSNARNRKSI